MGDEHNNTGDFDKAATSSKTAAMRSLRSQLKEERTKREQAEQIQEILRKQAEDADKARDERVKALEAKVDGLNQQLFDPKDGVFIKYERVMDRHENTLRLIKWVGSTVGGVILTTLVGLVLMKVIGGGGS